MKVAQLHTISYKNCMDCMKLYGLYIQLPSEFAWIKCRKNHNLFIDFANNLILQSSLIVNEYLNVPIKAKFFLEIWHVDPLIAAWNFSN